MRQIEVDTIYRHFKGNHYYVKEIALDSETLDEYVVYQALYGENKTYIRKLDMFLEPINENREDNITKQKYRFESCKTFDLSEATAVDEYIKRLKQGTGKKR